jgi:hypothetical protein
MMAQAVALLSCIREVPSSKFGRDTDNPEVSVAFLRPPRQIRYISLNQATATSFLILSN